MTAALRCLGAAFDRSMLDREAFKFEHTLLGHQALSLDNLARVVQELPPDHVFYSSGLLDRNADFDRAHLDHATGLSLKDTIENIRTSNSYVMVRAPESHPSFKPLFAELLADVEAVLRETGQGADTRSGGGALDPMLYLFIASPNSLTPFHIDRYSTFLLQFQGSKTVTVWPPWDERVVSAADVEGFCWFQGVRPAWRPESEPLGVRFAFGPGEALHIPFVAPHLVQNGPGEVSVSMSIIFKTARTEQQLRALRFNLTARKVLARVGATPAAIGHGGWRDSAKAAAISAVRVVRRRPG